MSSSGKRVSSRIGGVLIAGIWLLGLGLVGLVGGEKWLTLRGQRAAATSDPLKEGYRPFSLQHLNPHYLFFFPLDPRERVALSNGYATLTPEGFRGPGPELAQGRRLAFLVGGSVAFGYLASGDTGTITAALNRRQTNYFFVNAGVPSWNSSQELTRLAAQLIDYRPALVVALDGANDLKIGLDYRRHGVPFEPGYPESFHDLSDLVDDIRSGKPAARQASLMERWFPEMRKAWKKLGKTPRQKAAKALEDKPHSGMTAPESERMAAALLRNHRSMRAIVQAAGGEFLAVFQPVATLHTTCPPGLKSADHDNYEAFSRAVGAGSAGAPYLDLARCFDPGTTGGPGPAAVFQDQVHLTDAGNDEVARQIVPALP